jgi:hypothetical protein
MHTESQMFLNNTLWNGPLTGLLTSTTTFLNSNLATTLYKVPVPAGATATNFVQTTLPATQRTGIVTNAGFITSRARSDTGSVVARGLVIYDAMLCMSTPPRDPALNSAIGAAKAALSGQTAQEQVAFRASIPVCASCHSHFDPFGLVLENYDNIGTYRTMDDLNRPVDAHTMMPAELGGAAVSNAIDFAQQMSQSAGFVNCLAKSVLQYAMTDIGAQVDVPTLPGYTPSVAGCAAADVAARYNAGTSKTFTDMVRAVAVSPAFSLRTAVQ